MADQKTKTQLANYLKDLGKNLNPLPERDIEDILNEIESLVLSSLEGNKTDEDIEAILSELGHPKTLARRYKAHNEHGKPLPLAVRIGRGTAKGASKSLKYFVALVGYAIAFGFLANALLKPFFPDTIGFWVGGGGVIVGYPGASTGYEDLLGYWLIPLGLISAGLVFMLTRKITRAMK